METSASGTPSSETNLPGTSEELWGSSLAHLPEWMPESRTLTVVSPHPDDETLGAGGLIYTCAELGYEITVILVTDGEGSRPDTHNLAERRALELRTALMRLAPDGAHVVRLCLPDGKVAASESQLVKRLLRTVPLDSTLVAPYEQDGDSDNAATSRACQAAARKLGIQCVRYPLWAWDRLRPADLRSRPLVRLSLSEAARRAKKQAIECYQSQTESRPGSSVVPARMRPYFERPYEVFLV
jgi:LmbE family N-acetylglucosaminyl deacetylase